jgi:hypothetical protein
MKKLAAYHEAGHIVMCYLVGYTVKKSSIYSTGDGQTHVDYGNEESDVLGVMTLGESYQIIETKQLNDDVCKKMVCILLAGGISESIYTHGIDYVGTAKVEFSGPDMVKSENICKLKSFSIRDILSEYYDLLKFEDIWDAIDKLASNLLLSNDNTIEKDKIELTIKNSKFGKYL